MKDSGNFHLSFSLAVAMLFPSLALAELPEWQDPQVFKVNKEPPRASFNPFAQAKDLSSELPWKAENFQLLNGKWKFHWVDHPSKRIENFYEVGFDDSKWDKFPVPANWEINTSGKTYGIPFYYSHACFKRPAAPADLNVDYNPVGAYRHQFTIPKNWGGRQIFIHFGAVNSAFYIWVNGKKVGYSEDSKTPAEFDLTPYVKVGENKIALEVYRYSDGSFFECQDMWRISGIERDVYLYSTPKVRLQDYYVDATLDDQYRNGIFNFEAVISNRSEEAANGFSLKADLFDAQQKMVFSQSLKFDAVKKGEMGKSKISVPVTQPKQWSAEEPNLYQLKITLVNNKQEAIEYVNTKVGFRRSELKDGNILINGKAVKFKGVNRHDHDPLTAHVVSREMMRKDIELMKQANINALRASHYPNDPYIYELTDEYGLYVMNEANLESHGLGAANQGDGYDVNQHIVNKPEWRAAYIYRVSNMYERDKNYASVVLLSPGNETGDGPNTEAAWDWLKARGSRPVIFEQAQQRRHTDAYSQMYASVPEVLYYAENTYKNDRRPLLLIEYEHSMGNSTGNIKEYWDLFEKYKGLQGGFIWDWVDQNWPLKKKNGDFYWGYGGDLEPKGTYSNVDFCGNGLVRADRSIYNGKFQEVKKVYQNIAITSDDAAKGEIKIRNKNFFIDLSKYELSWAVVENGIEVDKGAGIALTAAAEATETIKLNYRFSAKPDAEYFLNLSIQPKANDGLIPKGFSIASEQLDFKAEPLPTAKLADSSTPLSVKEDDSKIEISNAKFSYALDKKSGLVTSLKYGKEELLKGSPKPNFWRAPTDNDFGEKFQNKAKIWRTAGDKLELKSIDIKKSETQVVISLEHYLPVVESRYKTTYEIASNGEIRVDAWFYAAEHKKQSELPRIGMKFELPLSFDQVEWYGRGPIENYSDRKSAAYVGLYKSTVKDLYTYYSRPQENGYKTDVRRVAFLNKKGEGVEFVGESLIGFGAQVFDVNDYEFDVKRGLHPADIKAKDRIFVNIDHRMRGIAGTDSWRTPPLFQYTIPWNDYRYSYRIRPYTKK